MTFKLGNIDARLTASFLRSDEFGCYARITAIVPGDTDPVMSTTLDEALFTWRDIQQFREDLSAVIFSNGESKVASIASDEPMLCGFRGHVKVDEKGTISLNIEFGYWHHHLVGELRIELDGFLQEGAKVWLAELNEFVALEAKFVKR